MSKFDAIKLAEIIENAFKLRSRPAKMIDSLEITADEKLSFAPLCSVEPRLTTASLWDCCSEAISFLSPEAFCYYIPGLMKASILEESPNLIAVHSVLSMLDRSPIEGNWEMFFCSRWTIFTMRELQAIELWVEWLSEKLFFIEDVVFIRAFETLDSLRKLLESRAQV